MLEDKIYKDYVEALKAKNRAKSDFLSFIRAELKNSAIELKKDKLEDPEVLAALKKQKKKLDESRDAILSSGRSDLIESIDKEVALLGEYLPKELTDQELTSVIESVISATGAASIKDMGRVMKEVLVQVGAKADSKKVSDIVKSKLSGR